MQLKLAVERLCRRWLLTRCPAARADISDSSPARTVAQMSLASCRALSPGEVGCEPLTPSISRQAP